MILIDTDDTTSFALAGKNDSQSSTTLPSDLNTLPSIQLWFGVTGIILAVVVVLFIINKLIDVRDRKKRRQMRRRNLLTREGSFKQRNSLTSTSTSDRQGHSTHLFFAFVNGTRRNTTTAHV